MQKLKNPKQKRRKHKGASQIFEWESRNRAFLLQHVDNTSMNKNAYPQKINESFHCACRKNMLFWRTNRKSQIPKEKRRKRRDASTIYCRKSRTLIFAAFRIEMLNFQTVYVKKRIGLLNKKQKLNNLKKRRRKRRDASKIFNRKSRNRTFRKWLLFSGRKAKKKFAASSQLLPVRGTL